MFVSYCECYTGLLSVSCVECGSEALTYHAEEGCEFGSELTPQAVAICEARGHDGRG